MVKNQQQMEKSTGAFFGSEALKQEYLNRLQSHYDADEIIHGIYWENGKGCAVGCTVLCKETEFYHRRLQVELNIPMQLWYLEDGLFEALGNGNAKEFPIKFLKAIPVGATEQQLMQAFYKFQIWLYEELKTGVTKDFEATTKVLDRAIEYYLRLAEGLTVSQTEWDGLAAEAAEAARAAWAVRAARNARAAWAAWAARAAWAAWAAEAAEAAWAAEAAEAAEAARTAWAAEEQKQASLQANKIIELLLVCSQ